MSRSSSRRPRMYLEVTSSRSTDIMISFNVERITRSVSSLSLGLPCNKPRVTINLENNLIFGRAVRNYSVLVHSICKCISVWTNRRVWQTTKLNSHRNPAVLRFRSPGRCLSNVFTNSEREEKKSGHVSLNRKTLIFFVIYI